MSIILQFKYGNTPAIFPFRHAALQQRQLGHHDLNFQQLLLRQIPDQVAVVLRIAVEFG